MSANDRAERRRVERARLANRERTVVPIIGHDLVLRLDPFSLEVLAYLTRSKGPRASRVDVARSILATQLRHAALQIVAVDHVLAVAVNWCAGKSPTVGPLQIFTEEIEQPGAL